MHSSFQVKQQFLLHVIILHVCLQDANHLLTVLTVRVLDFISGIRSDRQSDRPLVTQTESDSLWSSVKSGANHHLISAHQTLVSCREKEGGEEGGGRSEAEMVVSSSSSPFCLSN